MSVLNYKLLMKSLEKELGQYLLNFKLKLDILLILILLDLTP